ncbi:GHMP kinase [Ancylobacter dichloromethanicus]|uniref:Beta-ribofuranosylaminobenzene 5'-phosphate synthase n=1 Tax=Ancylobacter dichloromethanicus TaxID=518825 RepID=A0A9W6MXC9_9HYPH|nr:beta-ribofuranosylaminobenzene 5'-phosphate synthase family protein [Ancylobacter dichloromethanicus]MBS7556189.1 GHMP kinase [Ancylobacter dichloromethanicus]GLK69943.1 beta-ribofuranosylaminobenzene 5'-phosphate synthase [Ancylobacter dichloromethanicus]
MAFEETLVNTTTRQFRTASEQLDRAAVRITAPGRLHLGFLDLAGTLGRRFGSLGITLDRPSTVVRLRRAGRLVASGPDAGRAVAAVEKAAARFGLDKRVEVVVEAALPPHSGLGSGTQLGLAVATGLCLINGLDISPREIGAALGRGARSAIGIGAFTEGGVILDGGKKRGSEAPPPVLSRLPFPENWRILLVYDQGHQGLSGIEEVQAMEGLPPFADTLAGHMARLAVMVALPALAEGDVDYFAAAVGEMQRLLGEHYASAQGGRYTSGSVAEVMDWLEARGLRGLGQSSWGPTGFAILGSPEEADQLLSEARLRFGDRPALAFDCARGSNAGARVEWLACVEQC